MQSLNEKTCVFFSKLDRFQIGFLFRPLNTFFTVTPLAFYRTTAVSFFFFLIGFHGKIPLLERCLQGGPFPTQGHHYTQCLC